MKYTKKYLTNNKIAINTKTQKEYDKTMKVFEKWGVVWANGAKLTEEDNWDDYKKNTCVSLCENDGKLGFSPKDYYQNEGYTIITAKQFLKDARHAEATAKRVSRLKVGDKVRILKTIEKTEDWDDGCKEDFKDMIGKTTERMNAKDGLCYWVKNEDGYVAFISPKYLERIEEEETIFDNMDKDVKEFYVDVDKFVKKMKNKQK